MFMKDQHRIRAPNLNWQWGECKWPNEVQYENKSVFHKICQWMERDAIAGIHFLRRDKAPGNKSMSWGGFWGDFAASPAHLRNTEHKGLSLTAAQCNQAAKKDSEPFLWFVSLEIQHHKGDLEYPWSLTLPEKRGRMSFLVDWAL